MANATLAEAIQSTDDPQATFRRGFLLILPLWSGAIPAGMAYSIAALAVGLGPFDIQLMSLVTFSAAGQIGVVSLLEEGSREWLIVATMLALSAQLLLIGVAAGRQIAMSRAERLVTAGLLTDASYGVAAAVGNLQQRVILGSGVSMYLAWNLGTALGLVAGAAIPDPQQLGLTLVIPLAFLAVLVPLLRSVASILAAVIGAGVVLLLGSLVPGGIAVLVAGAMGSMAGAWLLRVRRPGQEAA